MSGPRRRAAGLVASLRGGAEPGGVLDGWPDGGDDRALPAIRTMLESLGPEAGAPRHRALLDRCEAFLLLDRPYAWPVEDLGVPIGAGPRWLPLLLLGLAGASAAVGTAAGLALAAALAAAAVAWFPIDRRLRRRWAALERRLEAAGDGEAWPFLRAGDVPGRDRRDALARDTRDAPVRGHREALARDG